jgi:hypothetical protein
LPCIGETGDLNTRAEAKYLGGAFPPTAGKILIADIRRISDAKIRVIDRIGERTAVA